MTETMAGKLAEALGVDSDGADERFQVGGGGYGGGGGASVGTIDDKATGEKVGITYHVFVGLVFRIQDQDSGSGFKITNSYPDMRIVLRGERVRTRRLHACLSYVQVSTYSELGFDHAT